MIPDRAPRLLTMIVVLIFALAGCASVSDHLTINADGSGTVVITTTYEAGMEGIDPMQRQMMMGEIHSLAYPPMNADEAAVLFEGGGMTILDETSEADGVTTSTITVSFKSINQLLKTHYAKARSLSLVSDQATGKLIVKFRSGLQGTASFAGFHDAENGELGMAMQMMSVDEEQVKALEDEFRATFTLTLPGDITADESAQAEGATAVWQVLRADHESSGTFAAQLRQQMSASCALDQIRFAPVTPTRLDLEDFDSLSEETKDSKGAPAIDTQKILAETQVDALAVMNKRTINYTGGGWGGENGTVAIAVITLPEKLNPLRWSEFELATAVDDLGNDLMPSDDDGYSRYRNQYNLNENYGWYDEEPESKDEAIHYITIQFNNPEITATSIEQLSGSINALYGGSPRVIKLPAVVGKIYSEGDQAVYTHDAENEIDHPALQESGTTFRVLNAANQGPGVSLSVHIESEDAVVKEIQAFDVNGVPWPTYQQGDYGDTSSQSIQLMIAGHPEPPLSLAILIDAASTRVKIPVELAGLPLTNQDEPKQKEGE